MDSGRANVDIPVVCKTLALILCSIALGLDTGLYRIEAVSNSVIYSAGGFIIVVAIFLGWTIFRGDVEKIYVAWMMTCGAIWNIGAGIGLIIYYVDYKKITRTMQLVGGCLSLTSGVVMLIDALHNFDIF